MYATAQTVIHNTMCKHIHMLQRYLTQNVEELKEEGPEVNEYNSSEIKLVASQLCKEKKLNFTDCIPARKALQETLRLFAEELDTCETGILLAKSVNKYMHLTIYSSHCRNRIIVHCLQ